jgi:hypothetical protein
VALLTDFGTRDWYVAAVKGVILSRAPEVHVVDITHEIPAQDVLAGAFVLAAGVPWFPAGTVFVGVVDPGVGSGRAILAARADRRYFVGPDNGLLAPSLAQARAQRVVRLTNARHWLAPASRTFQARDIMAPVAAFLARGGALARLGPPAARLVPLPVPRPRRRGRRLHGIVVHVDTFGNLITNLPAPAAAGRFQRSLHVRGRRVRLVDSYHEARPGELAAVAGSLGLIELAVAGASAAAKLRAGRGEPVTQVVG